MYGLLDRDLKYIGQAISKYKDIEQAIVFGSRAMGNYKRASDIDLALVGEKIDNSTLRGLYDELNQQYPIPYFFDLVNYNEISSKELKEHIDRVGKVIYKKD